MQVYCSGNERSARYRGKKNLTARFEDIKAENVLLERFHLNGITVWFLSLVLEKR